MVDGTVVAEKSEFLGVIGDEVGVEFDEVVGREHVVLCVGVAFCVAVDAEVFSVAGDGGAGEEQGDEDGEVR